MRAPRARHRDGATIVAARPLPGCKDVVECGNSPLSIINCNQRGRKARAQSPVVAAISAALEWFSHNDGIERTFTRAGRRPVCGRFGRASVGRPRASRSPIVGRGRVQGESAVSRTCVGSSHQFCPALCFGNKQISRWPTKAMCNAIKNSNSTSRINLHLLRVLHFTAVTSDFPIQRYHQSVLLDVVPNAAPMLSIVEPEQKYPHLQHLRTAYRASTVRLTSHAKIGKRPLRRPRWRACNAGPSPRCDFVRTQAKATVRCARQPAFVNARPSSVAMVCEAQRGDSSRFDGWRMARQQLAGCRPAWQGLPTLKERMPAWSRLPMSKIPGGRLPRLRRTFNLNASDVHYSTLSHRKRAPRGDNRAIPIRRDDHHERGRRARVQKDQDGRP